VSAATRAGVPELVGRLAALVTEARAGAPEPASVVVHRPAAEGFRVERDGDAFVVVGRPAERAVALNDVTGADALAYVHHRLRSLGVDRALARAGAREGDLVRIGGLTFEYEE
jgi:GTP-binding protein